MPPADSERDQKTISRRVYLIDHRTDNITHFRLFIDFIFYVKQNIFYF